MRSSTRLNKIRTGRDGSFILTFRCNTRYDKKSPFCPFNKIIRLNTDRITTDSTPHDPNCQVRDNVDRWSESNTGELFLRIHNLSEKRKNRRNKRDVQNDVQRRERRARSSVIDQSNIIILPLINENLDVPMANGDLLEEETSDNNEFINNIKKEKDLNGQSSTGDLLEESINDNNEFTNIKRENENETLYEPLDENLDAPMANGDLLEEETSDNNEFINNIKKEKDLNGQPSTNGAIEESTGDSLINNSKKEKNKFLNKILNDKNLDVPMNNGDLLEEPPITENNREFTNNIKKEKDLNGQSSTGDLLEESINDNNEFTNIKRENENETLDEPFRIKTEKHFFR